MKCRSYQGLCQYEWESMMSEPSLVLSLVWRFPHPEEENTSTTQWLIQIADGFQDEDRMA